MHYTICFRILRTFLTFWEKNNLLYLLQTVFMRNIDSCTIYECQVWKFICRYIFIVKSEVLLQTHIQILSSSGVCIYVSIVKCGSLIFFSKEAWSYRTFWPCKEINIALLLLSTDGNKKKWTWSWPFNKLGEASTRTWSATYLKWSRCSLSRSWNKEARATNCKKSCRGSNKEFKRLVKHTTLLIFFCTTIPSISVYYCSCTTA